MKRLLDRRILQLWPEEFPSVDLERFIAVVRPALEKLRPMHGASNFADAVNIAAVMYLRARNPARLAIHVSDAAMLVRLAFQEVVQPAQLALSDSAHAAMRPLPLLPNETSRVLRGLPEAVRKWGASVPHLRFSETGPFCDEIRVAATALEEAHPAAEALHEATRAAEEEELHPLQRTEAVTFERAYEHIIETIDELLAYLRPLTTR